MNSSNKIPRTCNKRVTQ